MAAVIHLFLLSFLNHLRLLFSFRGCHLVKLLSQLSPSLLFRKQTYCCFRSTMVPHIGSVHSQTHYTDISSNLKHVYNTQYICLAYSYIFIVLLDVSIIIYQHIEQDIQDFIFHRVSYYYLVPLLYYFLPAAVMMFIYCFITFLISLWLNTMFPLLPIRQMIRVVPSSLFCLNIFSIFFFYCFSYNISIVFCNGFTYFASYLLSFFRFSVYFFYGKIMNTTA